MSGLGLLLTLALAQAPATDVLEVPDNTSDGYTPEPEKSQETLRFTGYVDVGFAKAWGDGTSFNPQDTRAPLDYGTDAFASAVNSRGDVASINAGNRFTNGFLPYTVGIGGTPSFIVNTASVDVRFSPVSFPFFIFARLQAMPRFTPEAGNTLRLELQQAFGRLTPFSSAEFAVSLGRFDSVFGIEYLENEANLRVGITPSLLARYTTGHSLGAKIFYRKQLPALWSALSINVAATNSGTRTEALVPVDVSLVGVPVASARIGYELNLQRVQLKLGGSGLFGPRSDQKLNTVFQRGAGGDLRLSFYGVSLSGEFVWLQDDGGEERGKLTGTGQRELASGFFVRGAWGQLAWALPFELGHLTKITLSGRYEQRQAWFTGFTPVFVDRVTFGLRLEFHDFLILKAEMLLNRELAPTPNVDNNIFTSSAVFVW